MAEASVYVSTAVALKDIRAAVAALPKPAGVAVVEVDDSATECLGYQVAVDLFGTEADLRAKEYASRLSQKLSASVVTGSQLDERLGAITAGTRLESRR